MGYDGILFGNGLTVNLLMQLKKYIPDEKRYLLNVDDFLRSFINKKLSYREENQIYKMFYGKESIDKRKYFEVLRKDLEIYYEQYDANIEYVMGHNLFESVTDEYVVIRNVFPALYNVWHNVLMDYLLYLDLENRIQSFYLSVKEVLENPRYIWTTNFDLFAEILNPEHLHGYFIRDMRKYEDVVYKTFDDGKQYYYKYIWGWNGIGKLRMINEVKKYNDYQKYFDLDFFFANDIFIDKLLIYGMGFQTSGYLDRMKEAYPRYEKAAFGGIIDEHILMRIAAMQNRGMLNEVDVTYFSEKEKEHLEQVLKETNVQKYNIIKSQEFDFFVINK